VVDVWVFAIEFIRHQPRIFANMQLRAATHARHVQLLPGKHANSLAHFQLRSIPRDDKPKLRPDEGSGNDARLAAADASLVREVTPLPGPQHGGKLTAGQPRRYLPRM
jgi:hypothetical protein